MGVCVLTANPSSNLSAAVPFFPRRYFFLGILSPEIEFPVAVMPIRNSRRSDKGLATRHRCDAQLLLTLLQERAGRGYHPPLKARRPARYVYSLDFTPATTLDASAFTATSTFEISMVNAFLTSRATAGQNTPTPKPTTAAMITCMNPPTLYLVLVTDRQQVSNLRAASVLHPVQRLRHCQQGCKTARGRCPRCPRCRRTTCATR